MPHYTGFELIHTVRNNPKFKHMSIVMLTGLRERKDVERALTVGVDDYIVKPIDPLLLIQKVNSLFEKKARAELSRGPAFADASHWHFTAQDHRREHFRAGFAHHMRRATQSRANFRHQRRSVSFTRHPTAAAQSAASRDGSCDGPVPCSFDFFRRARGHATENPPLALHAHG